MRECPSSLSEPPCEGCTTQTALPDLAHHELLSDGEDRLRYLEARSAFLRDHSAFYGYGREPCGTTHPAHRFRIDAIREEELTRLHDSAYLDHAGAALYSETQVADALHDLQASMLGNPHRCACMHDEQTIVPGAAMSNEHDVVGNPSLYFPFVAMLHVWEALLIRVATHQGKLLLLL